MTVMRRADTIVVCIALLVASFQTSYSHIHFNKTSDHVRKSHLAQGLTLHTHLLVTPERGEHLPAIQSFPSHGENDAVFLPWAPEASHAIIFLTSLPSEPGAFTLPDQVVYFLPSAVRHSHDPPLVSSSAPRSPPA